MSRGTGRRFRKQLARQCPKPEQSDQLSAYSASGQPKIKSDLSETVPDSEQRYHQLVPIQQQLLENYDRELRQCSTSLTTIGCWEFLIRKLPEARKYGIERRLRLLVVVYARRFCQPVSVS